jgi:hypothetical protein
MAAFEEAAANDPDILGLFYNGSQGRGDMDRYSDLDIKIWAEEAALDREGEKIGQILSRLGEVRFFHPLHPRDSVTALIGPDWQRVDLNLYRASDLKPWIGYAGSRIVKDTDGFLARLVAESPAQPTPSAAEAAADFIAGMADSQIYLALHNARGSVWSAMGEVAYEATELYTFLARLRGRESYGFRYVEQILSPEEQALLSAVWPARSEREEVRRAGRALWDWTRFVWRETERVLGQTIDIRLDEAGLLHAVNRIYEWE